MADDAADLSANLYYSDEFSTDGEVIFSKEPASMLQS